MKYDRMDQFMQERIGICRGSAAALTKDHRADEAVFDKVRLNVYDIFRSVLAAAEKTAAQDVSGFFLGRMERITMAWQTSRDQAERHGNADKALIEAIKLDTAEQVRAKFLEIWEAET